MKIKITAESSCDLTQELLNKYDIDIISFIITINGHDYKDLLEISSADLIKYADETGELPTTSSINSATYEEFFKKQLNNGYDAVIHFALSDKLSITFTNATNASQTDDLKGKVFVINSKSLSTGIGLQAIYARELADTNKYTPEEIVKKVEARIPYVQASFVLEKLSYMKKGGRCSSIALLGANLLHIRPQILVKPTGKMEVGKKYLGKMTKVVKTYVENILTEFSNPDTDRVFITHASADDIIVDAVKSTLESLGHFKEILITTASAVITSHCGKNTIGILYINKPKEE